MHSSIGVLISLVSSFSQVSYFTRQETMGRYAKLVDTTKARATFKAQYRIPNNVEIQHYEEGEWLVFNRPSKSVVIPMIAFIEGEMELPMGRVT